MLYSFFPTTKQFSKVLLFPFAFPIRENCCIKRLLSHVQDFFSFFAPFTLISLQKASSLQKGLPLVLCREQGTRGGEGGGQTVPLTFQRMWYLGPCSTPYLPYRSHLSPICVLVSANTWYERKKEKTKRPGIRRKCLLCLDAETMPTQTSALCFSSGCHALVCLSGKYRRTNLHTSGVNWGRGSVSQCNVQLECMWKPNLRRRLNPNKVCAIVWVRAVWTSLLWTHSRLKKRWGSFVSAYINFSINNFKTLDELATPLELEQSTTEI